MALAALIGLVGLVTTAAASSPDGSAAPATPTAIAPAAAPLPQPPPAAAAPWARACSTRHPACVRTPPGALVHASAALAAIDRAWDALVDVVGAPAPENAFGGAWDVYLVDAPPVADAAVYTGNDPRGYFDRGQSFGVIDARTEPGCALDRAAARALARASLWRAAPATDEASAVAQSEALADLATPCGHAGLGAAAYQAAPERSVAAAVSPAFARGASMFYRWLDRRFGARPGAIVVGAWALAPTRTPADTLVRGLWANAPGQLDVLRASLANALWTGSTLEDIFGGFAVARASPPFAPPEPAAAWALAWPDHARRLASPHGVEPTGASYVVIDHAGAPPGARLRLEAQWEDYARMRWTALKMNASGAAIGTVAMAAPDRATHASLTLEGLDETDHVVVVGANVGSTEHPFYPAQGEWEAHGWMLTVEGQ